MKEYFRFKLYLYRMCLKAQQVSSLFLMKHIIEFLVSIFLTPNNLTSNQQIQLCRGVPLKN